MQRYPELRGLSDEVFARRDKLQVFVSSKMRGGQLYGERYAAANAVEATQFAEAWYWERNAAASPFSSETICLGFARNSDSLILILAEDLTSITAKEYEVAWHNGASCYIFLKDGVERTEAAHQFVERERDRVVTKTFRNLHELATHITASLLQQVTSASRQEITRARLQRNGRREP